MKNAWLDRCIHTLFCHYTLCTTEQQFQRELRRMKVPRDRWPEFARMGNTTVFDDRVRHKTVVIVCINAESMKEHDGIAVAALIAHEATHLWQYHLEDIGVPDDSSKEFEAYAIQHISETLMREYARQVFSTPKGNA